MKTSFLKIVLVLVFGVFCFSFSSALPVYSGAGHNMSGYAWSSNIGWISFNCLNTNTCGTSDYGVNKDESGNLAGYAWSPNIGWIQFGGLSGFPAGAGTTASNATVVGGSLVGWAKAISADGNGWDGWIALSGVFEDSDNYEPYGVTLVNNNFSGFAWGGEVVGWVKFDGVIVGVPPFPNLTASAPSPTTAIRSVSSNYSSTITNSGNASASGTITHLFQYDNDSNHVLGVTSFTTTSPAIAAGETAIVSNAHTFGSAGTRYVRVCADNNASFVGTVDESDENDNCSAWTPVTVSLPVTTYTVTGNAGANGSISPASRTVNSGSSTTFTVTPDAGYIASASGCAGSLSGTTYTTGPITANCTVTASFTLSIVPTCSQTHYKCSDDSDGTAQINSPSKWTWTCGASACSEKKSPGYIED